MPSELDIIRHLVETWHPTQGDTSDDPACVLLRGSPTYLPLLQPKNHYFWYGRREQSRRVLGLDTAGAWVEDGPGTGKVSWVYGADEQCFGRAPFALSPLVRIRDLYPPLVDIIWNEERVAKVEGRYLRDWQMLIQEVMRRASVDEIWFIRSGYAGVSAALGYLETSSTLAALHEALSSSSAVIRKQAVEGFWKVTPGRGSDEWLVPLAADPDSEVRAAIATALGAIGTERSFDVLLGFLNDEPSVQRAAIEALIVLGLPQAREQVLRMATPPSDGTVRTATVRMTALLALQTFWHTSDVSLLFASLLDSAAAVRAGAAYVLGTMGVEMARPELHAALRDSAPEVRAQAVWALAELNDESAIPDMVEFMRTGVRGFPDPITGQPESEPAIAHSALERLANQGSVRARQAIYDLGLNS